MPIASISSPCWFRWRRWRSRGSAARRNRGGKWQNRSYATHYPVIARNRWPVDRRHSGTARRDGVWREPRRSHAKGEGAGATRDSRGNRTRGNAARPRHASVFHSRMSDWPATKARRALAAPQRIGWIVVRTSGSHRTLRREGWPQYLDDSPALNQIQLSALAARAEKYGIN